MNMNLDEILQNYQLNNVSNPEEELLAELNMDKGPVFWKKQ